MKDYQDFGIEVPSGRTSGHVKVFCPQCRSRRTNKKDRSLSVDLDHGVWKCHYCGWKGTLNVGRRALSAVKKTYRRPRPLNATAALSEATIGWFASRGISRATLEMARITEGEHFMPQLGSNQNTIQFNFYLDNELINVKYRTLAKDFALESGAELIPYNIDAITARRECIITEGEMDCLSFLEVGKKNCISVPNGASRNLSYLDDFIDGWFEDKTTIYIAVDTDAKGLELRDELVRRFGSERCRVVTYGEGCKDANEHLMKYGRESLLECLAGAAEIKVEGVFTLTDFEESLDALYLSGMNQGVTIGHPNFDTLCSFETKRLAVVTGVPGSGKSEFLDEIAERLNIRYDWRFAFFSPENAPLEYHAGKLIEKLTGKAFSVNTLTRAEFDQAKTHIRQNFFFINPGEDFSVDTILTKARYLIRRYGIKALVIDPFNRLDIDTAGNKETDAVRDILKRLISFAQQNDVLIFVMAHPTKLRSDKGAVQPPTLYDIAGSAHFYNMADYGIVVHRDTSNEVVEIRVCKVRFKHLGTRGVAKMRYNMINGRYAPYTDQPIPWDNNSHLPPIDINNNNPNNPNTQSLFHPAEVARPKRYHWDL